VLSGSSWAKLPLLTIGLLGAQMVWSTEMGYGEPLSTLWCMVDLLRLMIPFILNAASPYLLSLGLSKSLMSVVFVAGPLSGLIVQPLIGMSPLAPPFFAARPPTINSLALPQVSWQIIQPPDTADGGRIYCLARFSAPWQCSYSVSPPP